MTDVTEISTLKGKKLKSAFLSLLSEDNWRSSVETLVEEMGNKLSGILFSAIYSDEPIIRTRAISCFGILTNHLWKSEPEKVRILIRRCIWMLTEESGGIPWGAPEIIGEIISTNQELAEDYVNILFSYVDEIEDGPDNFIDNPELRKSAYIGILKLSEAFPEMIIPFTQIIQQRLDCEKDEECLKLLFLIAGKSSIELKN